MIIPDPSTTRTLLLLLSAMNTQPIEFTHTSSGVDSFAYVATLPSPPLPRVPVPAIKLIFPVFRFTIRTMWFDESAKYK